MNVNVDAIQENESERERGRERGLPIYKGA